MALIVYSMLRPHDHLAKWSNFKVKWPDGVLCLTKARTEAKWHTWGQQCWMLHMPNSHGSRIVNINTRCHGAAYRIKWRSTANDVDSLQTTVTPMVLDNKGPYNSVDKC